MTIHMSIFLRRGISTIREEGRCSATNTRERIRQLMDERGWTIYRLARKADIPWSTLRNMFSRGTDPSIATLESVCEALGITPAQFFDPENRMGLSEEQLMLLDRWSRLSSADREAVLSVMDALGKENASDAVAPQRKGL